MGEWVGLLIYTINITIGVVVGLGHVYYIANVWNKGDPIIILLLLYIKYLYIKYLTFVLDYF